MSQRFSNQSESIFQTLDKNEKLCSSIAVNWWQKIHALNLPVILYMLPTECEKPTVYKMSSPYINGLEIFISRYM